MRRWRQRLSNEFLYFKVIFILLYDSICVSGLCVVTVENLELILSGFLKLYPVQTVHIHGSSGYADRLVPIFETAENIIITDHQNPKCNIEQDNVIITREAVFTDVETEVPFYNLTLNTMSGLVSADQLSGFWKNIKNKKETLVKTNTIQGFYSEIGKMFPISPANWLCLDCFQALKILQGARENIRNYQGLICRALIEESDVSENLGCSVTKLDNILNEQSLVRVANFETRHPAFNYCLYVRDLNQDFVKTNAMLEAEAAKRVKLENVKTALEAENVESSKKITELQSTLADVKEISKQSKVLGEVISSIQTKFDEKLEASLVLLKENSARGVENKKSIENLAKLEPLLEHLKQNIQKIPHQGDLLDVLKTELQKLSELPLLLKDLRLQNFLQNHNDSQLIADLWSHMAETSYKNQKFEQAAEYFQLAIDNGGRKAWCYQGMAESMARHTDKYSSFWYVPEQKIHMDKIGRWDAVVRLYRQALSIDSNIGRSFNERFMPQALAIEDNPIENPIYIVGCGHSGTSILLRLIGNHENIWPVRKESALFLKTDEHVSKLMKEWDRKCKENNRSRWIEKTPPHIFQIPRLLASRPNAQILLIIRDGRDVVASLKHREGYKNIDDRIDRWVYDNMAGLPFWDHERVHVLKYEDLVTNTENTLINVFEFLAETYSADIVKIFDGRGRWKEDLSDKELEVFWTSKAKALMSKFGYK